MNVRAMQQVRALAGIYRDGGVTMVLLRLWRWAVLWSPISPVLLPNVGEVHIEKLRMYPGVGYWPQIRSPRSFNEKVAHRKLFSDEQIYAELADKSRVRDYVRQKVGEDILNDVYCVANDPDRIPFDTLPREFVIKPTHMSGAVRVIDNKRTADTTSLKQDCREWLSAEFGTSTNEYWYLDIEPRLVIEKRLRGSDTSVPLDYKFFVFHGRVELIEVDFDRFETHGQRFFDRNWESVAVKREHPLGPVVDEPGRLDEMIDIAETLGGEFNFVRVDLYNPSNEGIVFGELTFSPSAGRGGFQPQEYDFRLGRLW